MGQASNAITLPGSQWPERTRTFRCACGTVVVTTSRIQKRCSDCAAKKNRERTLANTLKRRRR